MDWDTFTDKLTNAGENLGRGLKRVFGSENERIVRKLEPLVAKINELETWAEGLSQEEIQDEVKKYMEAVQEEKATLDDLIPEMFALVREASVRTLGLRHYDVQLVGGYTMHKGRIAEMMTGEGKTLVATLALSLNALSGRPCYLVTVNDYLAKRDANWMRPIYEYLGLTVGSIQSDMDPWSRKPIYESNIVYGTNNEFGFDYLRDNMKTSLDQQVQKDLYFAIVDEVDSILVDESRTPLIISGPAEEHIGKYKEADKVARVLKRDEHYEVKEKERSASLTEVGIEEAERILNVESFYVPGHEDWPHYLENAIRAYELYNCDKEYVVEVVDDPRHQDSGPQVVIVDEFTGRKMIGRRWSDGLHQAVEVKEGLEPRSETQTLGTVTFQNYFRMFEKLSGMTGTAITEAAEFHKIYGLDVTCIPTNMPVARADNNDVVYRTEPEKWNAIADELERLHEKGQPVLVGTASVETSEKLSTILRKRHLKHEVLNAKNHEREAQIIAMAGEQGAITVATNMAGRGTDIKLGGNFEHRLKEALDAAGLVEGDVDHLEAIDRIRSEVREKCEADEQDVLGRGGLYVLGTERHEARRIDNQLRGRTGRQGNVGESRFYLSLQDELMRIFYRDWVTNMMEKLGMSEGQEIESGMVTRAIGRAQKKVEERNFEIRKSLLEYDEVMDVQRKEIYSVRQAVLEGENLKERIATMLQNVVERNSAVYEEDPEGFKEWCQKTFDIQISDELAAHATDAEEPNTDGVHEAVAARYDEREEELGEALVRRVEQYLMLNAIDAKWKDHLHAIDALKAGIGLRGYGQQDPKIAYKKEGTELFSEQLLPAIENEVTSLILRIQVARPEDGEGGAQPAGALQPRGIVSGTGARPMTPGQPGQQPRPTPEQIAAYRKQVMAQQARQAMRQAVPATNAFDMMKRQKAVASAQAQKAEANKPAAEAQKAAPAAPAAPAQQSKMPPEWEGTGRNDPCPCGSGKKFKKCHG
ncbi:MAG: preprotein translocase subunit SecA [bacterium]|nr:preprotein translocase subunit SecA [bacterium]